jgi:hypothetical protein
VLESLSLQLPQHVRLTSNFDLYNLNDPIQTWDQARTRIGLQHKLYQSLTTRLYVEYARVNQQAETLLQETDLRGGIDLRYTKKIPTGTLNLSYRYYRHGHRTEGIAASLNVLNELQTLRDGQLTLLNKPYVETGTVVIKDVTGTRIYQEDFDFLIIQRGSFTEIRRIPGGQIPDQGEIYVDYVFRQPGSYSYGANNNHFSASILLFKQLLEIYYRYSVQDYPNVEQGDLLTLNFYSQHVYGLRLDLGFMRGGVESDVYDSNIIPYRMMRYYMDMNWNIKSRILLNFNGSIRDYTMIDDEVDQLYSNLSGKIAYKIRSSMQVSLQSGYLDQSGLNIDLELLTARAEFQSVFRKLHLRAGLEMYRRMYRDSEFAFNGLYLQLTRRF